MKLKIEHHIPKKILDYAEGKTDIDRMVRDEMITAISVHLSDIVEIKTEDINDFPEPRKRYYAGFTYLTNSDAYKIAQAIKSLSKVYGFDVTEIIKTLEE